MKAIHKHGQYGVLASPCPRPAGQHERQSKTEHLAVLCLCTALVLMPGATVRVAEAQPSYSAYYRYLGNYPDDADTPYADNIQGLAHDDSHWFISQAATLWKVDVSVSLAAVPESSPHVLLQNTELQGLGFNHIGDIDSYNGYLFVPIEGGGAKPYAGHVGAGIAFFQTSNLQLAGWTDVGETQASSPWCAVSPDGRYLYTGGKRLDCACPQWDDRLLRYQLDWSHAPPLIVGPPERLTISYPDGFFVSAAAQGGEVSPDGRLLYMVHGYYEYSGVMPRYWGITVIDLTSLQVINQSTNGDGLFNYEFHPNYDKYEEPEGLTIWDLDDGRAPGVRGQIHVLLVANWNWDPSSGTDKVYVKHYTGTVHVDGSRAESGDGKIASPFRTVNEAVNFLTSWNWSGSRISIKARSYPEAVTLSHAVRLEATGGTVIIGR
jgi:hypothetical protein